MGTQPRNMPGARLATASARNQIAFGTVPYHVVRISLNRGPPVLKWFVHRDRLSSEVPEPSDFRTRPNGHFFRPPETLGSFPRGPGRPARRQWGLRAFRLWGLFALTGGGEVEEQAKHYLANGGAEKPAPAEALEWAGQTRATMVDLKFCDLLGTWQHMTLPITSFDEAASTRASGSTARRSAAGRGSPSRTCC